MKQGPDKLPRINKASWKDLRPTELLRRSMLQPVELPASCVVCSRFLTVVNCHPCWGGLRGCSCLWVASAPVSNFLTHLPVSNPVRLTDSLRSFDCNLHLSRLSASYQEWGDIYVSPGIVSHSRWTVTCNPNKPFPTQVPLGHGLYHSNRNQTRTIPEAGTS